ncbi:MAG TPA: nitric oxide-sensing protein NosP [Stellaceae bacterium]|jgi:hypothetical protein|nr:nitric oxide-sensing protein NosP [Stellaceae bacterium]
MARRQPLRGGSQAPDARQAIAALHRLIGGPDISCVILFCSPQYHIDAIAAATREYFGETPVFGCTTAGEIGPFGYINGGVCGIGFPREDFVVAATLIDDLAGFELSSTIERTRAVAAERDRIAAAAFPDSASARGFALLLIDGLSMREEQVVSAVATTLGDTPLVGGSAGDDLNFRRTWILYGGRFVTNAAALILIATRRRVSVFKTEHFLNTERKVVVTGANPAARIVTELNAAPAAFEYARMVGLAGETLSPRIFAAHPLMVRVGGLYHVRAIQKVNPDQSLTFFCAIDEGLVLTIARSVDVVHDLEDLFARIQQEVGEPGLIIGCDCVLRNIEIEAQQLKGIVSELFVRNGVIGFCTYGEQFHSMHVNQTFTGVAIGAA